jgi:two-component system, LytTR family, response regulator
MRALIVDDEPLARSGVAVRLSEFRDIEIVGECGDGPSALQKILELSPDVVFLDVQMPGMDGFEVLRALPGNELPLIIFLTAYEQHALRAFEVHALDYLLKPLDDERFAKAVQRARQAKDTESKIRISERLLLMLGENASKYVLRFAVRTGSRIQVVLADDIEWIAAAGDYAEAHCGSLRYLLHETMTSLEQKLDPEKFLRIHRSRIIRMSCVRELHAIENREYLVKLSDGSEQRSSRTYADRLEDWLSPHKS